MLTHLKEKLQFVQGENGEQRSKLRDIEVTVAHKRDKLTHLKQVDISTHFMGMHLVTAMVHGNGAILQASIVITYPEFTPNRQGSSHIPYPHTVNPQE